MPAAACGVRIGVECVVSWLLVPLAATDAGAAGRRVQRQCPADSVGRQGLRLDPAGADGRVQTVQRWRALADRGLKKSES